MEGLGHLVKRFFGAARPGAPSPADEKWAIAALSDSESTIWERMNNPDRRHAIQVARDVEVELTTGGSGLKLEPWVLSAALLHDSGKVVSGFRTPARVVATILWSVAEDGLAETWVTSPRGFKRRMAQYRNHPKLGAELLRAAGAHEHTCSWAEQHHLPRGDWSLPVEIAEVLKRCDDD